MVVAWVFVIDRKIERAKYDEIGPTLSTIGPTPPIPGMEGAGRGDLLLHTPTFLNQVLLRRQHCAAERCHSLMMRCIDKACRLYTYRPTHTLE